MKRFANVLLPAIVWLYCCFSCVSASAVSPSRSEPLYEKFSCGQFLSYAPANKPIDFSDIDYPLLNAAIFFATNRARLRHGEPPLHHSGALERAAVMHSRDMVEYDFFDHKNPFVPQRKSPFERMSLCGVGGGRRAENIATDFGVQYKGGSPLIPPDGSNHSFRDYWTGRAVPNHTYNSLAESVVEGWMKSEGHRLNILDPKLKYLGTGAFHFRDRTFYGMDTFKVTEDFASDAPE